jgi:2'-5' RNA ligase
MKSLVVYTCLPDTLAALFPLPKTGGLPTHVTLCWVGRFAQDGDHFDRACTVLSGLALCEDVTLGCLNYFVADKGRIAHVTVDTVRGDGLVAVNAIIVDLLRGVGLEPDDTFKEGFHPHVTLAWLRPRAVWTGDVPEGEWTIGGFEIRHGFKHARFPSV